MMLVTDMEIKNDPVIYYSNLIFNSNSENGLNFTRMMRLNFKMILKMLLKNWQNSDSYKATDFKL
jgi:hypothetical protein